MRKFAHMDSPKEISAGKAPGVLGTYLLKYGVPLVISVGLCWLLFRGDDFNPARMWEIVKSECDFRWMLANIALQLMAQIFRAYRWRLQLRALRIDPSLWQIALSIFGTYSVNLVFPRLGEVWRTGYIAAREKAPFSTVFGSMVADRLADTITVLALTLLVFIPAGPHIASYMAQGGGIMAKAAALLTSPLLWAFAAATVTAATVVYIKFPTHPLIVKIKRICNGLWEGFAVIIRMRGKGLWVLFTALIWGCYFLSFYCAMQSFTLTARLADVHGLTAVAVCFLLSSISMGVPSNGGIGPWQWAVIFSLSFYSADIVGFTREYALTFANFVMGVQTLVLIVQGLLTFGCIAACGHRSNFSGHKINDLSEN